MNEHRYYPSLRQTIRAFNRFADRVCARLKVGAKVYNNRSFSKEPHELLRELREECLDLAGWAFILHSRLERAEAALKNAQRNDHDYFPDFGD